MIPSPHCETKDCESKLFVVRVRILSKDGKDLGIGGYCINCRDEMRAYKGYSLFPLVAGKEAVPAKKRPKPSRPFVPNDAVVEDGKVKFGARKRHVPIPMGWGIVDRSGKCRKGDKFLDLSCGGWALADEHDEGMDASEFACLIRPHEKAYEGVRCR